MRTITAALLLCFLHAVICCSHLLAGEPTLKQKGKKGPAREVRNVAGMTMILIDSGTFTMGMKDFRFSQPLHEVEISRPFYIGQTEVTQAQWRQVMGTAPWVGPDFVKIGPNVAATCMTWFECVEFCQRLTLLERSRGNLPRDWHYSLPTEAQWEYACRAGTDTEYCFGDDKEGLSDYGWWGAFPVAIHKELIQEKDYGNARYEPFTHEVGLKKPNPWRLYDMHGNASEWCVDHYDATYYQNSPQKDPRGPDRPGIDPFTNRTSTGRVLRGGDWSYHASTCTSGYRLEGGTTCRHVFAGFRVIAEPATIPQQRPQPRTNRSKEKSLSDSEGAAGD